jgi:hypothetical protein
MSRPAFLCPGALPVKVLRTTLFFCLSILFISLSFIEASAQGNLLVTPRRVVFDGPRKTQELNLANNGKDTARYLISTIEIKMKEDGTFQEISQPDSGQNFASDYIRFFPRSVTLAPGEAQVVKVQLKNTGQMMAGEYRSHLYFRAVPEEKPLGEAPIIKDSSAIAVHLTPVFGISLPVIIRMGKSTAEVNITDVALYTKDKATRLNITFNRSGNMSVYGDLKVDFIAANGKVTEITNVRGIAVYTPTLKRQFSVALDKKAGVDYSTGKLHITYTLQTDDKLTGIAEAWYPGNSSAKIN